MIIDFIKDPDHARNFDCLDLDTGRPLDVFYADDEAGVYRAYVRSGDGPYRYHCDPATGEPLWEERRGRIRVIPIAESPRGRRP